MTSSLSDGKWWVKSSASDYFSRALIKYFVQLYMSYKVGNNTYRLPSTGILVEVNKSLLWVSAGHVVEAIIEQYKKETINDLRWIDRWDISGADTLPFQRRDLKYYSGLPKGSDFGAILLSILEAENFRSNNKLKPLIMRIGKQKETITEPEGYLLAGFPWEVSKVDHTPVSSHKEMIRFSSKLICLPLMKKEWKDLLFHEEGWDDNKAFYGELLPYSDIEDAQPDELKGMSGGPVFSFYRDNAYLNIELEGIFDSYIKKSHQIRAEPTDRVFVNLEAWLNEFKDQ